MADRISKQYVAKGRAANPGQQARPFQCKWHEGCAKSFNRKSDLQRHYRIHTNERPYACDYKPCEKTFIQRSALTVHRRTHTGDKPHKCPYLGCGKCFSDSSSLARHRRIHTNDKPYICKNLHCRKAFCRKTTMTKHFRKEHPAESIKEEEDAEYSDIDDSDEEVEEDNNSLSHEDSYENTEACRDAQSAHSRSSTYSADLWPLPGQPQPKHLLKSRRASITSLVKSERELSRTPQRIFTESYPSAHEHHPEYMLSRSHTMPSSVPQSMAHDAAMQQFVIDDNNRMWHPQQQPLADSPTSLSSGSSGFESSTSGFGPAQGYQVQNMTMPSHQVSHYPQQHSVSELQAVHDIVLDEPQQHQYTNMPSNQPRFTSVPQQQLAQVIAAQQQHYSRPGTPNYPDELPSTPGFSEPLFHQQFVSSVPSTPLGGNFSMPQQQFIAPQTSGAFYNDFGLFKEPKLDNGFDLLPGQLMQGQW